MEPAIARSAVTNSALTRSDITCPRIARAEIARAEIARAEIARSAIARSAIARSDDKIGRVGQKGICQCRRGRPIVKRREIADGRQSYPSAIGERGTRESVIAAYSFLAGCGAPSCHGNCRHRRRNAGNVIRCRRFRRRGSPLRSRPSSAVAD